MDALGKALAAKAGASMPESDDDESEDSGADALDECCEHMMPDMDRGEARSLLKSAILQVMNEK